MFRQLLLLCPFDRIISNTKCISVWKRGIKRVRTKGLKLFYIRLNAFQRKLRYQFGHTHRPTRFTNVCACAVTFCPGAHHMSASSLIVFASSFLSSHFSPLFLLFLYLLRRCLAFSGSFSISSSSSTSNIIIHYHRRRRCLGSMDAFVLRPYNSGI